MKIYRRFLGCLLVFFIVIGVMFLVSYVNEHRSADEGTLIWEQQVEEPDEMRGAAGNVSGHSVC